MIKGTVLTPIEEGKIVVIFDAQLYRKKLRALWSRKLGFFSLAFSLAGFLLFLSPMLTPMLAPKTVKEENKGFESVMAQQIKPEKKNFLLSIEKIGLVETQVISEVNMADEKEYKEALKKSVVHAQGTAFPGQDRMIYIFSHSTNYPWLVKDLNALFFKLETLELGDKIKIEYNSQHFIYNVFEKRVVEADEVGIIYEHLNEDILILQTCYPPGTFWKRLLIFARPAKLDDLI